MRGPRALRGRGPGRKVFNGREAGKCRRFNVGGVAFGVIAGRPSAGLASGEESAWSIR